MFKKIIETVFLSKKRDSYLIPKTKVGFLNAAQLEIIHKLKNKQMTSLQYVCSKALNETQNEDFTHNGSKRTVATQTIESDLQKKLYS